MWIALDSQQAVDDFGDRFGDFHDACLREVSLATETYVDEQGGMACPGHLDTSALLFFQSQNQSLPPIEVRCTGVTLFVLRPTAENCDSIIQSGRITLADGRSRLSVSFLGGPLIGPPDSVMLLPTRSHEDPDLEVVAQSMAWRPLEAALGDQLRYRTAELHP